MRIAHYDDLIQQYENPITHACDMREGQVFIANGWQRPENFCGSAWDTFSPPVMTLAHGDEDLYDGRMKNKNPPCAPVTMVSDPSVFCWKRGMRRQENDRKHIRSRVENTLNETQDVHAKIAPLNQRKGFWLSAGGEGLPMS